MPKKKYIYDMKFLQAKKNLTKFPYSKGGCEMPLIRQQSHWKLVADFIEYTGVCISCNLFDSETGFTNNSFKTDQSVFRPGLAFVRTI